jgi:hypothetical protein
MISPSVRAISLAVSLIVAVPARAVIINSEWNAGNGNWNVAANWDPVDIPDNASGRTHYVKIGNRPVAAGAVVTYIPEDGNFDTVSALEISGGAELFTNSRHLNVFGQTTVTGTNSRLRIGPHDNHEVVAFRSFNIALSNGGALLLNDAAISVDSLLEVNANTTLAGPGQIVSDLGVALFKASGSVVTTDMLHLDMVISHIEAGALLSGGGGLHIPAGRNLYLAHGADVGLMIENHGNLVIGPGEIASAAAIDLQQQSSAVWELDIFGADADSFDRLALSGDAQLSGKLQLMLGNGYVPALGATFEILETGGDRLGEFTSIMQPTALPSDLAFDVRYQADSVELIVVNALPGDFNRDSVVDTADFAFWQKTFSHSVPAFTGADANGDTKIDTSDYELWRRNFGLSIGGPSVPGQSIPEPSALILLLAACAVVNFLRPPKAD